MVRGRLSTGAERSGQSKFHNLKMSLRIVEFKIAALPQICSSTEIGFRIMRIGRQVVDFIE
jgi:hypothetical protein